MNENAVMPAGFSTEHGSIMSEAETPGQMLRKARNDAGLHIAALAVSLRVPVKRIEALENGQMDLLPDIVFVRALTSSICQVLKVDPTPILDKLPKVASPRLNRDDIAINAPIGISSSVKEPFLLKWFTSPWLLGAFLLCVGAVGLYFWPNDSITSLKEKIVAPKIAVDAGVSQAKEIQVATDASLNPAADANTNTNANQKIATVTSTPTSSDLTLNTPVAPVNTAAAAQQNIASDAATAVPTAPPSTSVAAAVENTVVFKAKGQTWVEVKNAKGLTVFKKLLVGGETAGTSASLPVTVIVGRVDVTQVEVRGKPFDLTPVSKNNIARFEVK